jgi:hypothetical protein
MLKIKELKMMLKETVLFFVLQLLEIVLPAPELLILLNNRLLGCYSAGFQFSVLGSGFFVLAPEPAIFNSLYRVSDSL